MRREEKHCYDFGSFRLDVAERLLLRRASGRPVPLTGKVFDILRILVENHGHLVEKDALVKQVWAESFVEENNLTVSISTLRKALGETPDNHPFIETVPRRGYRFTAEVREVRQENTRGDATTAHRNGLFGEEALTVGRQSLSSLAVLPFVNASPDPRAEYLSDGITESIINILSRLPALRVMARVTVFRYKNRDVDVREAGSVLGVGAVLLGRLMLHEDRLIVGTELVDAASGCQLWGERYNRQMMGVFELEEEIAREIAEALRVKLTAEHDKQLAKRDTKNIEAYQSYFKGRHHWSKYSEEGLLIAAECFRQAIDADPGYALAYAGLADCYYRLSTTYLPPKEAMPKAKAAVSKALEIDPALAEAHASLGLIKMTHDWDWSGAAVEFRRAVELNPNSPSAHQWYATYLLLVGRFDEAVVELEAAQELDPLSFQIRVNLAVVFSYKCRYERALDQLRKAVEINPDYWGAYHISGFVYACMSKHAEAIAAFKQARSLNDSQIIMGFLGYTYAAANRKDEARAMLGEMQERAKRTYVSAYCIALIYLGLGEREQALAWLEKAFVDRDELLMLLKINPWLDSLRSDARFADLLSRIGLASQ